MTAGKFSSLAWARVDLRSIPQIVAPPPGPSSNEYHRRCTRYFKGLSSAGQAVSRGVRVGQGLRAGRRGRQPLHRLLFGHLRDDARSLPPQSERGGGQVCRPVDERPRFHHAHQDEAAGEAGGDYARRFRRVSVVRCGHGGGRGGHARAPRGDRAERDDQLLQRFSRQDLWRRLAGADPLAGVRTRADAGRSHGSASRCVPPVVDEAGRHGRHRSVHYLLR